jgi:pyruvate/2-oxoglutarate/acetoin dehydrogenase E1 component
LTIVALSYALADALLAAGTLAEEHGIEAEVIDLRWLRPLDPAPVCESVRKTGRLLVVDTGHTLFGVGGEVIAQTLSGVGPGAFKAAPARIGLPDTPVPACSESTYYPGPRDVVSAARALVGRKAGRAAR